MRPRTQSIGPTSLIVGGLWHVNDTAYSMFCAMEHELQQHLTIDKAVLGQNRITILVNKLALNTEVLFHWNEILEEHSHVPEEEAALLLRGHHQALCHYTWICVCHFPT